jgi:hypothetical protein
MKKIAMVLSGLTVFAATHSYAFTGCMPTKTVAHARADLNQQTMTEQNIYNERLAKATATLDSMRAAADAWRLMNIQAITRDADHSAERMNVIQAEYNNDLMAASTQYNVEVNAAVAEFNESQLRSVNEYNTSVCAR